MTRQKTLLLAALALLIGIPTLGYIGTFVSFRNPNQGGNGSSAVGVVSMMGNPEGIEPAIGRAVLPTQTIAPDTRPSDVTVTRMMPPYYRNDGFVPGIDQTYSKSASISLVVKDVWQSLDQVTQLITGKGGILSSSNTSSDPYIEGATQAIIVMRVPSNKLEEILADLHKLSATVTYQNIDIQNVTAQRVSFEETVKNLQTSEEDLRERLKQASSDQEKKMLQAQLKQIQNQIETTQKQLQNFTDTADMSVLTVTLSTKAADQSIVGPHQNSFFDEIKLTFRDALQMYRGLFIVGLRIVLMLSPLLIIAAISWLVWKRQARKSKSV